MIVVGGARTPEPDGRLNVVAWDEALSRAGHAAAHRVIDTDMTAILYTSGSTGKPKGVVLSHRNMVAGAMSVAQYLENHPGDRILSALPLSFDAGFSQLTTAFHAGASVTLINYLLPRDIVTAVRTRAASPASPRCRRSGYSSRSSSGPPPPGTTCAISPTRADACPRRRSTSCAARCPRPCRT